VRGGTPGSAGVAAPQCMQNCASAGSALLHEGQARALTVTGGSRVEGVNRLQ